MKKAIVVVCLFITFLIIYFLQSNFFCWFTIAGIMPNMFVILALFISLFAGIKLGIGYCLFFGIFLDIVQGQTLGTYTIMLVFVAILGWLFEKNFSKDSRFTIMLMVMTGTILFELGRYIFNVTILGSSIEILYFIKILIVEVIYNAIITIIIYPLIQIFGYKIEDIYKGQKILTRYF